jgi:hypothetical protein
MKFTNGRYYSRDNYSLTIISRIERNKSNGEENPRIYAFSGFSKPSYYKIKVKPDGREYVVVSGHIFKAE